MAQEPWRWDVATLAQAIRERSISSREAVSASLVRLDAVNPGVNAIVETLAAEALAQADRADEQLAKGDPVGVLHGVPVTTNYTDQKGRATSGGVKAFADLIAQDDSPSIANSAPGRRDHDRPDQRAGIFMALVHRQRTVWRNDQSVECRGHMRRFERRRRRCGRDRHLRARARHRLWRIDPASRLLLWRCGIAADVGTRTGAQCEHRRPSDHGAIDGRARPARAPRSRSSHRAHGDGCGRRARSVVGAGAAARSGAGEADQSGAGRCRPPDGIYSGVETRWSSRPSGCKMQVMWSNAATPPSIEEASNLWSLLVLNESKGGMIAQIREHGGAAIRKAGEL